jgi:hypothetical protein
MILTVDHAGNGKGSQDFWRIGREYQDGRMQDDRFTISLPLQTLSIRTKKEVSSFLKAVKESTVAA